MSMDYLPPWHWDTYSYNEYCCCQHRRNPLRNCDKIFPRSRQKSQPSIYEHQLFRPRAERTGDGHHLRYAHYHKSHNIRHERFPDHNVQGRQFKARRFLHQQPAQANRIAPREAWRTVSYRKRRYNHNQLSATTRRNHLGNQSQTTAHRGGLPGISNRYLCLDIEDVQPESVYPQPIENEQPRPYYTSQNRAGLNRNWRRNRDAQNRQNKNEFDFETPAVDDGNSNQRPVNSTPATPGPSADTTPELEADKLAVEPHPVTSRPQETNTGYEHNFGILTRANTLTWADLLRPNKDCNLSGSPDNGKDRAVQLSATSSIINKDLDFLSKDKQLIIFEGSTSLVTTGSTWTESEPLSVDSDKYYFFGEEGFDSIRIDSKLYKFAVRNGDLVIFEIKKSVLHKINFNLDLVPPIIRFISQFTSNDHSKFRQQRKFGPITVSSEYINSDCCLKIAKEKGSSIIFSMGPQKSSLLKFLAIFSNFVGKPQLVQEEPMHSEFETSAELTSISKLIFNFEVQRAYVEKQKTASTEKQPLISSLLQAYSDASDSFDPSDDSYFSDDFLGHATESDRRPPISEQEQIRDSTFNRAICRKSQLITSENCLPTDNLNTQLKIYRKSQKNKRRHSMRTRSQTKEFPWT
ncbi:unnamed protein product [Cuscuta epithymum]|uniref:Uncharacterized protein n=1 Tax=Cuscuta epithymum TaxID=186058 RepID=A0AAV0DSQ2_9ASTE|nr:unnamed protein product [Cuscuta epithymum]